MSPANINVCLICSCGHASPCEGGGLESQWWLGGGPTARIFQHPTMLVHLAVKWVPASNDKDDNVCGSPGS